MADQPRYRRREYYDHRAQGARATALADEWATCMRSNGDPNQADPIIDSHGVINITTPPTRAGPGGGPAGAAHDATGQCSQYLTAAQNEFRAKTLSLPFDPNEALLAQYVELHAGERGPELPLPHREHDKFQRHRRGPEQPLVQKANDVCGKQMDAASLVDQWLGSAGRYQRHAGRTESQ